MRTWRCKLAFVAALLGLHLLLGCFPQIMQRTGVGVSVVWFRDTHSMLAASDSAAAGFDPFVENPYDVAWERHIYPDWWYALARLGLTREDYFWLGALLVGLFWLTVVALLPLRSWREVAWSLAVCGSPPFWLAINRANADLLVFVLLTSAVWLLMSGRKLVRLAAPVPVALAIGLKFFPALGGVIFLGPGATRGENRQRWLIIGLLAVVLAWSLADDVQRFLQAGWFARGSFTFGAAAIPLNLGYGPEVAVNAVRLTGLGLILWGVCRPAGRNALPDSVGAAARQFCLLGVAVLAGSFFLTVGYLYKIIFVLWLFPAYWEWRAQAGPGARTILLCLVGLVWVEGLACAAISTMPALAGDGILIRRTAAMIAGLLAWGLVAPLAWWFGTGVRAGWPRSSHATKESDARA